MLEKEADARAMQYYTRQQLQGGGAYAKGVKCGNWNEDTALVEAKLREFIARKEEGACALLSHGCVVHPSTHGRGRQR